MTLTPPRTLSPSKITLFKDCALAFRYSAVDRLPEPPSMAAFRGTFVHRILELLMHDAPTERTRDRAEAHLHTALGELRHEPEYPVLGLDDPDLRGTLTTEAGRLLDRYFELEDPTSIRPVGLEIMLSARIGDVVVRGIIDRLELDGDDLVVTDYKSGRSPSMYDERARLLGVTVYAFLCEEVLGRRPARVQLVFLSDRTVLVNQPSDQAIRGLRRQVGAVWDAVLRACRDDSFRARPSRRCDWCGYRPICPAHGGTGPLPKLEAAGQHTLFDSGGA